LPSGQRLGDGADQFRQSRVGVLQMHAQGPSPALDQYVEVAARLRCLHHAEAVAMAGDLVLGIVAAGEWRADPLGCPAP